MLNTAVQSLSETLAAQLRGLNTVGIVRVTYVP